MEIISEETQPVTRVRYAGFWLRVVAFIIDTIAMSILQYLIILPIVAVLGLGAVANSFSSDNAEMGNGFMAMIMGASYVTSIVMVVLGILYYIIMETSRLQGTLGKMALGLKVTNLAGGRISAGQALGRYFGKILSTMILFIGLIMAGFTEKKQALHDYMAGTLVIKSEE